MKLDHTFFRIFIPLTSISDIAFILLIFIILISLSGTAQKTVHLLPEAGSVQKLTPGDQNITVLITDEKQYINGVNCTENMQLAQSIILEIDQNKTVVLYCHQLIPFGRIRPLLDLFESSGFHTFRFAVKKIN